MLITEISEKDFRKLNIKVYKKEWIETPTGKRLSWVSYKINDILDREIALSIEAGYEEDREHLSMPVTIAIHKNNFNKTDREHPLGGGYFDKFMNQYIGETTYYTLWGINHLYSNRDYFYVKDDYCRVKKSETEIIYRVHLKPRNFVLKHKTEEMDWPYDTLPEDVHSGYNSAKLEIAYDLQSDGSWKEIYRSGVFTYKHSKCIITVDKDGKKLCASSLLNTKNK